MAEEGHEHPHMEEGIKHAGSKITELLMRHVGPWPLWVWMAASAAGIGAAILIKRRGLGGLPEAPPIDPGSSGGGGSAGGGAGSSGGGPITVEPTGTDTSSGIDNLVPGVNLAPVMLREIAPIETTTTTLAPYVRGGTIRVPSAVVSSSLTSEARLAASGYPGVNTVQPTVIGDHPASAASPAGGGTYAGLTDKQTAGLFQATYGDNWQPVWQAQHAAEVAANGA